MDIVYVIFYNGEMYKTRSRKTAYLEKKYAKQVISADSKTIAIREMNENNIHWYEASKEVMKEYIDKVKSRFEIREFIERKDN